MANPWLKKNPFMSLWLSAANRAAGSIRGQATAEANRQVKAAAQQMQTDAIKAWTTPAKPSATRKKRPRQR